MLMKTSVDFLFSSVYEFKCKLASFEKKTLRDVKLNGLAISEDSRPTYHQEDKK